jgi:hypothetical protein
MAMDDVAIPGAMPVPAPDERAGKGAGPKKRPAPARRSPAPPKAPPPPEPPVAGERAGSIDITA